MIPYHPTRKYSQRPDRFRLAPDHPYREGCIFAGVGNLAGSKSYFDSSVYQNNGIATSAVWSEELGRSVTHLNGSSDHIALAQTPSLLGTQSQLTAMMWVNSKRVGEQELLTKGAKAGGQPFALWHDVGFNKYALLWTDSSANYSGVFYTSRTPGVDIWRHIAVVITAGQAEFFVDGAPDANSPFVASGVNGVAAEAVYGWNMGYNPSTSSNYLLGSIADVVIVNQARGHDVIQSFANPDNIMLDDWVQPLPTETFFLPLEEAPVTETVLIPYHTTKKYSQRPDRFRLAPDHSYGDGCVLASLQTLGSSDSNFDSTVYQNHGVFVDNPIRDIDLQRNVIDFAARSHVRIPYKPTLYCVPMTAVCWSYARVSSQNGARVMGLYDYVANKRVWSLSVNQDNYQIVTSNDGSGANGQAFSRKVQTDDWHHVGITTLNAGSVSLVYDGATLQTVSIAAYANQQSDFFLGGLEGGGNSWDGWLTDHLMWNRILSDDELKPFADRENVMLDDWIQPLPTETYFLPISQQPQPTELVTDIFESALFN